jgi:uncharacterized protein YbjQ (UPF0145 family)
MAEAMLLTTDTVPSYTIVQSWPMAWTKGTFLDDVLKRVAEDAQQRGANAVVGLRIVTIPDANFDESYLVYGTPVTAVPK